MDCSQVTDEDIRQTISDKIANDPTMFGTIINPVVQQRAVLLVGRIESFPQRQTAIQIARSVECVTTITDHLVRVKTVGSCNPATEQLCCGFCIPITDPCLRCQGGGMTRLREAFERLESELQPAHQIRSEAGKRFLEQIKDHFIDES